jgi:hypothetical protein
MYVPQGAAGGITKLSELEINVDKDWERKGIFNIKEVAQGMVIGDIVQHDGAKLVKLSPGTPSYVLTSEGAGKVIVWAPGGTYYERFFPVSILGSHAEAVVVPQLINKSALIATSESDTQIPTQSPALTTSRFVATVTPQNISKTASPGTQLANERTYPISGAVADDGGVQTDETIAANNDTANDMTLLPAVPAVNDAYYFAYGSTFGKIRLNQGTAGAGEWTIVWEYWNGTTWAGLSNVNDETNGFRASGHKFITFDVPGDWATTTVAGLGPYYWVRSRMTTYTSITTQPLGTRAWIVLTV